MAIFTIGNCSDRPQTRWCVVPIPLKLADELPDQCTFGPYWGIKGKRVGSVSQLFYVYVTGAVPFGWIRFAVEGLPDQPPPPPFALSDWIFDDLSKLVPSINGTPLQLYPVLYEDHPVRKVWRFTGQTKGKLWCELFMTTWTWQDVIDLKGTIRWADRGSPDWYKEFPSIDLKLGEEIHLDYAERCGFWRLPIKGGYRLLDNGKMPDGACLPFRGVVLPKKDSSFIGDKLSNDSAAAMLLRRLENLEAAKGGPICGGASWKPDHWFALGVVPEIPSGTFPGIAAQSLEYHREFRSYLEGGGHVWDSRPLALAKNAGQTGSQAPFGATKDAIAVTLNSPYRVFELLFSADDYLMRPHHHVEDDGSRLMAKNHANWPTWSAETFTQIPGDYLGKSKSQPWGWHNGRGGPDDQHDGFNYIAAAMALSGDELLYEGMLDMLETDRAMVSGRTGAPRAMGRLCQKWSRWLMLLPLAKRPILLDRIEEKLQNWTIEHKQRDGLVVRPSSIGGPDPRVLGKALKFWVPWQESLLALGLYDLSCAFTATGVVGALPEIARRLLLPIVENHVLFGVAQDGKNWIPLNGVQWFDGDPGPAGYYDVHRAGASTVPLEDTDLLLGNDGWWSWHGPAVLIARKLTENEQVLERAAAIRARYLDGTSDWSWSEWLAV